MTSKSIRNWFQILEDTLIGELLRPFAHTHFRKPVNSSKFFFFDCGVANYLRGMDFKKPNPQDFGVALENLVYMELRSQISFLRKKYKLFYWRSQSQVEVDFIITDALENPVLAIEVKSSDRIKSEFTKGLISFAEEFPNVRKVLVFTGATARQREDGIEIWPVQDFLMSLNEFF